MNLKASFLGSYFAYLLRGGLGWLLLVSSPFVIVQCSGGGSSGGGEEGNKEEHIDRPDLVIVDHEVSTQSVQFGDSLSITLTVRNQGTGISGGDGGPQEVIYYRSSNKFVGGPKDEKLGTSSFGVLDPKAESHQSFSFIAGSGDSYYGACLGTSDNCTVGIKVSVPMRKLDGSTDYMDDCTLSRADGSSFTVSGSVSAVSFYGGTFNYGEESVVQGDQKYYLLNLRRKGILSIWTTGSSDMVASIFTGNCGSYGSDSYYYVEDGGIGGENNFQIEATAEADYYFLVVHEKSLKAATFQLEVRLFDDYFPLMEGADPLYPDQWHLDNTSGYIDINVLEAWDITRGDPKVLVAVLDSGVEITHPDLAPNHDDRYDNSDPIFHKHGTAVAGLIVAVDNNGIGVSGVAPEVGFVSLRNGSVGITHSKIVAALVGNKEQTAISNNSWGLESEGRFLLIHADFDVAIEEGITNGYGGKGIFYAFAGGNYHREGSNNNYSGTSNHYAMSIICAVGSDGTRSAYSEKGANLWLCAPSDDGSLGLTTTDIVGIKGYNSAGDYTRHFGGTSGATPIVSGVAALIRSANPELGWRDIRLILAATAQKNDSLDSGWFQGVAIYDGTKSGSARYADTNTKYNHNHSYGFGVVDAGAAVMKSQNWNNVGEMVVRSSQSKDIPTAEQQVPDGSTGLSSVIKVTGLNDTLDFIEYVNIELNMDGEDYGDLQINLTSPANKISTLAEQHDCFGLGEVYKCVFGQSTRASFGSARHLGESPDGNWTLEVIDEVSGDNNNVYSWGLKFYGHKKP